MTRQRSEWWQADVSDRYVEGSWTDADEADYESEDLSEDEGDTERDRYVGRMWGRWGYRQDNDFAKRAVVAHGMVQTFVNAFALGATYRVTFDPQVQTAGTDFASKQVVLTASPLQDTTLTTEQAGTILTGLAAHEVAHVRYGRNMIGAVRRVFGAHALAAKISNILADVHDERRFAGDFPGYAGVFKPLLAYVVRDGSPFVAADANPSDLACAAIRYPTHVTSWDGAEVERDWWQAWARKWSREDAPKRHVEAVRVALDHIAEQQGREPAADDRERRQIGEPSPGQPAIGPTCPADGVDSAAVRNGVFDTLRGKQEAEQAVQAEARMQPDGDGNLVDVLRYVPRDQPLASPHRSGAAVAAVRDAFMRSRSGHTGIDRRQARGRLVSHDLDRVARQDYRVFSRRHAPDPGRLLIWVLVDCSSSMGGKPIDDATAVATALADASRTCPNVRMAVWGWSDPFTGLGTSRATAGAARVWETGMQVAEVGRLRDLDMGMTPDAIVIGWAWRAILKDARPGERPVIIVGSDGFGQNNMSDIVGQARRHGVDVRSVALGHLSESAQEARFGRGNYITWQGSMDATARPLGTLVADLAGRAAR
jgi:hypothetical protein